MNRSIPRQQGAFCVPWRGQGKKAAHTNADGAAKQACRELASFQPEPARAGQGSDRQGRACGIVKGSDAYSAQEKGHAGRGSKPSFRSFFSVQSETKRQKESGLAKQGYFAANGKPEKSLPERRQAQPQERGQAKYPARSQILPPVAAKNAHLQKPHIQAETAGRDQTIEPARQHEQRIDRQVASEAAAPGPIHFTSLAN